MRCYRLQSLSAIRGIALLELLVAVFLSLLLISAITRVYFTLQKVEIWRQHLEAQQETAQKMINILRGDIFMAGYIGCGKLSTEFTVRPYRQYALTKENALIVEHDKLTLRYQFFPGAAIMSDKSTQTRLIVETTPYFHAGDVVIISDCQHAEIFRVENAWVYGREQIIIPEAPLYYRYHQFAEIGAFTLHQYYLHAAKHQPNKFSRIHALFQLDAKNRRHQLLEGVDELSFSRIKNEVYFEFKTLKPTGEITWHGFAANRCCNHR